MGWARPFFFVREKGWAKREFHNVWGWVIVCKESHTTIHVENLSKF